MEPLPGTWATEQVIFINHLPVPPVGVNFECVYECVWTCQAANGRVHSRRPSSIHRCRILMRGWCVFLLGHYCVLYVCDWLGSGPPGSSQILQKISNQLSWALASWLYVLHCCSGRSNLLVHSIFISLFDLGILEMCKSKFIMPWCILLVCMYPHMKFYLAYEIFSPSIIATTARKSPCWSLRYVLVGSDLWWCFYFSMYILYIYPENSLYFYSSCNDNNVEPVPYVSLTYFVAACLTVYFDMCLAYNRVTQSCIDCMWNVCETEIIKCVSRSTVGKAHSSPQPPQMLSLCLLMPLNDSNIQIFIQVSDSRCGACVCSCMQAKLNVWMCDMMRSPSEIVLLC